MALWTPVQHSVSFRRTCGKASMSRLTTSVRKRRTSRMQTGATSTALVRAMKNVFKAPWNRASNSARDKSKMDLGSATFSSDIRS